MKRIFLCFLLMSSCLSLFAQFVGDDYEAMIVVGDALLGCVLIVVCCAAISGLCYLLGRPMLDSPSSKKQNIGVFCVIIGMQAFGMGMIFAFRIWWLILGIFIIGVILSQIYFHIKGDS